jgi:hypothetical protein
VAGPLIQVGASLRCPHVGQVAIAPSNTRVLLGGQPAATATDTFVIAGCTFMAGPVPHPCVKVQWLVPAARVRIGGQPALLQSSTGLCVAVDLAPQGAPQVVQTQARVTAT